MRGAARINDVRMAQFVLKIEKLSHIMGPGASQDLRSQSPIMAPGQHNFFYGVLVTRLIIRTISECFSTKIASRRVINHETLTLVNIQYTHLTSYSWVWRHLSQQYKIDKQLVSLKQSGFKDVLLNIQSGI